MKARLLLRDRKTLASGALVEMVIWELPHNTPERPHSLKYRLVYVRGGRRLIGYDNETSKGDHRHISETEYPYRFVSVDQLLADFWDDVRKYGGEP
jgi:hypothetical protein